MNIQETADMLNSIYNGWLPFVSVAMSFVIAGMFTFSMNRDNARIFKGFVIICTLIQFGAWLFIRYGAYRQENVSFRDVAYVEPTALFFTLLGITSLLALMERLPKLFKILALLALGVVLVMGLFPFWEMRFWSAAVFIIAMIFGVLIFSLLLLYATNVQQQVPAILRGMLLVSVWIGSLLAVFMWMMSYGIE